MANAAIETISALQLFDSRGYPTIECTVLLVDGSIGTAMVPSGASTGEREALELRDGDSSFEGKGVTKAIKNITGVIAPALKGREATDQQAIDHVLIDLDGTPNKKKLGANATLGVSMAVMKAAANSKQLPLYLYIGSLASNTIFSLPMPQLNIFNGGKHAEDSTDIQEFMIIPIGADNFPKAMQIASEIYHVLKKLLKTKGYETGVGDEGGFEPRVKGGTEEALDLIVEAVTQAHYQPGKDVGLGMDVAASELIDDKGVYSFKREARKFSTATLIADYERLLRKYPIISLEDGLGENDWDGWKLLNQRLGQTIQLVGDDLLVTNAKYLERAIASKEANAILIKPNQIGTVSETIHAVSMAKNAGWRTVISHRSGETEDTTISHLAVGLNAGQIKTGSFARSERIAKYNELLRINANLTNPTFANPFKA